MKTVTDLNALIPAIIDLVLDNPEIGNSYLGKKESDRDTEWAENYVCYDEDGWFIEISFKCTGEMIRYDGDYDTPPSESINNARGEVTEIIASHYDDDSGDGTVFNCDDLKDLWRSIDKALERI